MELLIAEFESDGPTDGFMSIIIAIMFFFTVYALEMVGRGLWFGPWMRGFLGDYAYPVSPSNLTLHRGPHLHDNRSPQLSGQDFPIFPASFEQQMLANCPILELFIRLWIEAG